jgi:hypothetical protein
MNERFPRRSRPLEQRPAGSSLRRYSLRALYWVGVLVVLLGLVLRFYFQMFQLGVLLAVVGVGLLLLARVNSMLFRR